MTNRGDSRDCLVLAMTNQLSSRGAMRRGDPGNPRSCLVTAFLKTYGSLVEDIESSLMRPASFSSLR